MKQQQNFKVIWIRKAVILWKIDIHHGCFLIFFNFLIIMVKVLMDTWQPWEIEEMI